MKLSIVMPVYNAEKYLCKAVDSVLKQTFQDFELILVDDGSTDSSAEICDRLKEQDDRIRVIHQANQGIGGARNTGLCASKGDYIGFMDNDDLIHPQMFELLTYVANKENADIVMLTEKLVDETWNIPNSTYDIENILYHEEDISFMYQNMFAKSKYDTSYVVIWNKIYRREILENVRFPEYGAEDSVFNCQAYIKANRILVLDSQPDFYYWIQRKTSTCHSDYSMYHCMRLKSFFDMEKFIYENVNSCHKYILDKTYRRILSTKFDSRHTKYADLVKQILSEGFSEFQTRFIKNEDISTRIKIVYSLFYYLPITYAFFRKLEYIKAKIF